MPFQLIVLLACSGGVCYSNQGNAADLFVVSRMLRRGFPVAGGFDHIERELSEGEGPVASMPCMQRRGGGNAAVFAPCRFLSVSSGSQNILKIIKVPAPFHGQLPPF